jgi:hypothetical protein
LGSKNTFYFETSFPTGYACLTIFKDQVISLFPNVPSSNDENFHEEGVIEVIFSQFHHPEERNIHLPLNSNPPPTF